MNFFELNDYNSENEEEYNSFDEETLEDKVLYDKLESISKFKNHIDKEPEFYGITKISDVKILNIIEKNKENKKNVLSEYQIELFIDLYKSIKKEGNINNFNFVYEQISKIIFVSK